MLSQGMVKLSRAVFILHVMIVGPFREEDKRNRIDRTSMNTLLGYHLAL